MQLALKLLFQFRVEINGSSGVFRKCEERYIVIENVENVVDTINNFYKTRKEWNHSFISTRGHKVYYEFIGVMDYILWGCEQSKGEFWYDYTIKKLPMENKSKLTMSKAELLKRIRENEKKDYQENGERLDPHVSFGPRNQ